MLADLLEEVMPRLAARRPIFHSEADFQLALAWEIQIAMPDAQIRLEKRIANEPRIELDLLVVVDGHQMGLELKYPKRRLDVEVNGERFALPTGAPDIERYDVWRDVARLERLIAEGLIDEGCALVLTNSPGLWTPPTRVAIASYDAFRIHEGRRVSGTVDWGASAGPGTRTGRTDPLALVGSYVLSWRDFSEVGGGARFRYLPIIVSGGAAPGFP